MMLLHEIAAFKEGKRSHASAIPARSVNQQMSTSVASQKKKLVLKKRGKPASKTRKRNLQPYVDALQQ